MSEVLSFYCTGGRRSPKVGMPKAPFGVGYPQLPAARLQPTAGMPASLVLRLCSQVYPRASRKRRECGRTFKGPGLRDLQG